MARVNGIFKVTGSLQNVSFYTMKGSDKVYMRTKGGPSARRLKKGPEFELVLDEDMHRDYRLMLRALFAAALEDLRAENQRLRDKLRYYFDCEQAMFEGMHNGGQTLAAGPFDEMQETERELREMVGWKPAAGQEGE